MRICIPFDTAGIGGPTSFVKKLSQGLNQREIDVVYDFTAEPYDVVLVVNATRHMSKLWQAKKQGKLIVQRLGGLNWMHHQVRVSPQVYFLREFRNLLMRLIRQNLADSIVYQSKFVKEWWRSSHGVPKIPSTIIFNGVDLNLFNPTGEKYQSAADVCMISVEGTQGNDPHNISVNLATRLQKFGLTVELLVFGEPQGNTQERLSQYPFIIFKGVVANQDLPYYYRGASFYLLTDVIAACPNSVLEALACGTPVLGYDAGAFPELVDPTVGRCIPPVGDPWKVESPGNYGELVKAAQEIITGGEKFRQGARTLAEKRYGLDQMVENYLDVFHR